MTVTGNPAEFTVNGVAATVNSLTVPFSPIQDLNGYANPWPGGGGVNKLDPTHTYTGMTYNPTVGAIFNVATASQSKITDNGGGSFTFDVAAAWDNRGWIVPVTAGNTYRISVKFSGAGVRTTVGLLDSDYTVLTKSNNASNPQTISETYTPSVDGYWYCCITTNANNDITIDNPIFSVGSTAPASWTPYSNICPISGRTGLNVYVSPTQDPDDATVYNVVWSTQAGTVYGGTLDVVTGELVVDRGRVNVSSSWYWYKSGSYPGGFYTTIENAGTGQKTNTPFICSHAKTATSISQYVQGTCFCDGSINIRIMDGSNTVQDWKDYINAQSTAGTPIQICYKLATPITYQLTPQTINLLAGIMNYVWSDTDEDITISFDVAAFIRHLFRVNGVDFSRFVERDSYATSLEPVYAETIQTMDGVNHTALLRTRGSIRLRFNPQTDSDTAALCSALLAAPCEVQYRCLQRDVDVTALMCVDTISAQFLSRCLYLGDEWNQIESITLTEL